METIFVQIGAILLVSFIVAYIVRAFKQPLTIGYIIAGIIISPFIVYLGASKEVIQIFSEFGIAFLLFIVGLHLNPKIIKEIGVQSLLIGLGQIFFTFIVGFLISSSFLGFDLITSVYVGIALAFSSTIIVMKILSDKKELDLLHGKICTGILIIQDLVAIIVLMFISSSTNRGNLNTFLLKSLLGGSGLIVLLIVAGFYIMPKFIRNIAKSQEVLFLFSIAWCFVIAALFSYIGFSMEIGALIAGVVLSISPYSTEISSKIKPLRDFFLIIFFIILGLNIQISSFNSIIFPALILSLVVLVLKPLILMMFMTLFNYTKRTNFLVGTTLAQISEFSLIILTLGLAAGHITSEVLSILTLAGIITITISTYMINFSNKIYKRISYLISFFERKNVKETKKTTKKYDAILFGYNRIGFSILRSLKKIRKNYLVVDFNPDTINSLKRFNIPCLYGDIGDIELLSELPLEKVELAVSTIPEFDVNKVLIDSIRRVNKNAIIIVRAHHIDDAFELYNEGADYVLTPHFLGGEYVSEMIRKIKVNPKEYKKQKEKHIKQLKERTEEGYFHHY